MMLLDKILRYWRVKVALKNRPEIMENVFDISCDDGYLLRKLVNITKRQDGIDPCVKMSSVSNHSEIKKGFFPSAIEDYQMQESYDTIFALAVFEHLSESDLRRSASVIARMLSPEGRLIITIPHPFVDKILDVLISLHLIEGMKVDEHHGFGPDALLTYFSDFLRLVKRERFQFGLNNIFVFKRL
jgi:2-polyprenyl-3-methyl-5-hydroxy-6-metoxy-1,4-benzoquinol methylase